MNPNLARTGAACARLSTSLDVARPPASASSCDATPSNGLVCTSDRSARRTRSLCAGCTPLIMSPSPKPATISGAYVSMSGHITRMSRGSSVSSSASRPSRTSRRTSIWRAGPWQLCTCTERSSGLSVRPSRRTSLAVMSDCSQPSRVSGRSWAPRYSSVCGSGGRLRCSSRRSRPRVASSGCPTSRWLVSSRRGIWPRTSARDCHSLSLGCGSHR